MIPRWKRIAINSVTYGILIGRILFEYYFHDLYLMHKALVHWSSIALFVAALLIRKYLFHCPHCGFNLSWRVYASLDQVLVCPHCRKEVKIQ